MDMHMELGYTANELAFYFRTSKGCGLLVHRFIPTADLFHTGFLEAEMHILPSIRPYCSFAAVATHFRGPLPFDSGPDGRVPDRFWLALESGYLYVGFNVGSGDVIGKSVQKAQRLDDGFWHQVVVNRSGFALTLAIDGSTHFTLIAPMVSSILAVLHVLRVSRRVSYVARFMCRKVM